MSASDVEAEVIVTTVDGNKYDINNMPGKKKKELIKNGQIAAERFIVAPNMPGKLLAAKRKEFLAAMEKSETSTPDILPGEMVKHKGMVVEVAEIDPEKKKLMYKKGKKKVWTSFKNVQIVSHMDGSDEEDENG